MRLPPFCLTCKHHQHCSLSHELSLQSAPRRPQTIEEIPWLRCLERGPWLADLKQSQVLKCVRKSRKLGFVLPKLGRGRRMRTKSDMVSGLRADQPPKARKSAGLGESHRPKALREFDFPQARWTWTSSLCWQALTTAFFRPR